MTLDIAESDSVADEVILSDSMWPFLCSDVCLNISFCATDLGLIGLSKVHMRSHVVRCITV